MSQELPEGYFVVIVDKDGAGTAIGRIHNDPDLGSAAVQLEVMRRTFESAGGEVRSVEVGPVRSTTESSS